MERADNTRFPVQSGLRVDAMAVRQFFGTTTLAARVLDSLILLLASMLL